MPPQEARVWTTARKVYGNVLPLVVASPLLYQAAVAYGRGGPSVVLIYWIAAFLAGAWVALALMGYVGNGSMRREMSRRMHIDRPFDRTERYFVGFARPVFRSALDPHEDVGFLVLHPDRLEFWGSERKATLEREAIAGVCFRPNTHSLVGLGRWVSVEAVVEGKPVRLLVEPRGKATLLGNFVFSRRLLRRIEGWMAEGPRAEAQDPSESSSVP